MIFARQVERLPTGPEMASTDPASLLEEAPMSAELLAYYRSRVASSEGDIVDLRARIEEIELSQVP